MRRSENENKRRKRKHTTKRNEIVVVQAPTDVLYGSHLYTWPCQAKKEKSKIEIFSKFLDQNFNLQNRFQPYLGLWLIYYGPRAQSQSQIQEQTWQFQAKMKNPKSKFQQIFGSKILIFKIDPSHIWGLWPIYYGPKAQSQSQFKQQTWPFRGQMKNPKSNNFRDEICVFKIVPSHIWGLWHVSWGRLAQSQSQI